MHIEVSVALNFVISYLYNKLPRRRVNIFGEELEKALKDKFQGHWYPEKPFKVWNLKYTIYRYACDWFFGLYLSALFDGAKINQCQVFINSITVMEYSFIQNAMEPFETQFQ